MKYCLNCEWQASTTDESSDRTPSRKAIDHHVKTGHSVDSSAGAVPPTIPNGSDTALVRELFSSSD
ncbi:hypothetical protein [Natronorubrum thiooxidans]|uniref:Uncharacterized protein n=1 Tax=Natronorubrum thiooxidans TaxID=308853 RepID=A0A1N7CW11_9EURY|nr:hypothetical protein [Natronorubrum thiooxidans]SIR67654.1 hypothetical protein SAMN05421752_101610 [Natronorubrum thiooxidans]